MSIYAILASKPHNPHYLKRYVAFIEGCQKVNKGFEGYTEKHHICPKAKDLFPEYKSFSKHPWNKVVLTARQHFIAHWILWKAYPGNESMMFAFWQMSSTKNTKPDSRTYEVLRETYSKFASVIARNAQRKRVKNGTHIWLGGYEQRKRVEDGTHNLLGGELVRKKVEDGTHNFLGGEISRKTQRKRVENGTHNFLGGELQRNNNKKRVENGTHPFLGGEIQRKRIEDGTHNLLGGVTCYDRESNVVQIPKDVYHSQEGPKEEWEFVTLNSKEGKRRKSLIDTA